MENKHGVHVLEFPVLSDVIVMIQRRIRCCDMMSQLFGIISHELFGD